MLLGQPLFKELGVVQVDSCQGQLLKSQVQPTISVLEAVAQRLHQVLYKAAVVPTVILIVILPLVVVVVVDMA